MACDIILTAYNNLELTRKCLASILGVWRQQDSLIIVDNGSDRETADFLQDTASRDPALNIRLIRLDPNQGFLKAANTGLKSSDKEYACLISNDTVVTKGWLDEMEKVMVAQSDIGVLGPSSNTYGLHPGQGQSWEALSGALKQFSGQYSESTSCVGFCMLIRREVISRIGYLDEIYGQGYFEDTDFCRRALKAGFRCAIAKAAYVWHREHSTFSNKDRDACFRKNKQIFEERWGRPQRILCVCDFQPQALKSLDLALAVCLDLAKKGHWIWVIGSKDQDKEKFKKLSIHGNIKTIILPRYAIYPYSLFKVFIKRKKKIDCVYVADSFSKGKRKLFNFLLSKPVKELSYG
jgi:GT2 family glycosyltransferase